MVSVFPNLCLWRRSLRSNVGGIDPEKLYRATLKRAGFANATLGALKLLPCPLGTFVNASRLECVECPAGKIYVLLHDYY